MAQKGDHDGKSGRSDTMSGSAKQHGNKNENSRTGHKQNGGHGGHK